jgi:hypothetical protein
VRTRPRGWEIRTDAEGMPPSEPRVQDAPFDMCRLRGPTGARNTRAPSLWLSGGASGGTSNGIGFSGQRQDQTRGDSVDELRACAGADSLKRASS